MLKSISIWCGVFGLLASCGSSVSKATAPVEDVTGGGTEAVADKVDFSDALSEARSQQDRIVQLSRTREQDLPTSGAARFEGSAWIEVFTQNDTFTVFERTSLIGDASIDVNFSDETVKGDINIIAGELLVEQVSPTPTDLFNFEEEIREITATGEVLLGSRESEIGEFDDPDFATANAFQTDYIGTVTTSEGVIELNGNVSGEFFGNRVNNPETDLPFKGLFARTSGDQTSIDGAEATARVQIGADSVIP